MVGALSAKALDPWEITVRTGEVLQVRTHGYTKDGDEYVFEALLKGAPRKRIELLRLPQSLVNTTRSH